MPTISGFLVRFHLIYLHNNLLILQFVRAVYLNKSFSVFNSLINSTSDTITSVYLNPLYSFTSFMNTISGSKFSLSVLWNQHGHYTPDCFSYCWSSIAVSNQNLIFLHNSQNWQSLKIWALAIAPLVEVPQTCYLRLYGENSLYGWPEYI
jgi:hypothetical protein